MFEALFKRSASLLPQAAFGQLGWLRGSLGAGCAIAVAGFSTAGLLSSDTAHLPWLIAPLGASAVLVFAVPASPLAQPWSVVGGNLVSATLGLSIGMLLRDPLVAASLAVGLAIAVMAFARCLHPPGGACALLCAIGASGPEGWTFIYLLPIAANVICLALVGVIYNNLTGHRWPHVVIVPPVLTDAQVMHTRGDIETVLAGWDEVLDVDVDDLDQFCRALNDHLRQQHR